jgi:hypothetical protein
MANIRVTQNHHDVLVLSSFPFANRCSYLVGSGSTFSASGLRMAREAFQMMSLLSAARAKLMARPMQMPNVWVGSVDIKVLQSREGV